MEYTFSRIMAAYDGIWSSLMPCSKRTGDQDIGNFHIFVQISSQKRFVNNLKVLLKYCKLVWDKLNQVQSRRLYDLSASFFALYCFTFKYWVEYYLSPIVEKRSRNQIKLSLFVKMCANFQIIAILNSKVIIFNFYYLN